MRASFNLLSKSQASKTLIKGTIILTATGLLSRVIGFFFRIFLSQHFGEEGMGLFQLTSPVFAIAFSLTASGYQTAISKFVAVENTSKDYSHSLRYLMNSFIISFGSSLIFMLLLYKYADFAATNLLLEPRTAPLIRMLALSVPLSSIHSCAMGYFYGLRKTAVPSISQLLEQIIRVGFVYIAYDVCVSKGMEPTIGFVIIGLIIGELVSALYCLTMVYIKFYHVRNGLRISHIRENLDAVKKIMTLSAPLTANRVIVNLLLSVEAVFIPSKLQAFGHSPFEALSIYGVLTGMAYPLVFFPSALTNSVAVLIMPLVSEADESNNNRAIRWAVLRCIKYCLLLGAASAFVFFVFGKPFGRILFHSELAGHFIMTLSFICPAMYLTSTLSSILHGMGRTTQTFIFSLISLSVRLGFVFFLIPQFGIEGYLWGILASQIAVTVMVLLALRRYWGNNSARK